MSKFDLFDEEQSIILDTTTALRQGNLSRDAAMDLLTKLLGRYEKLFREMQQLVKMSDAKARQFNQLNHRLKKESAELAITQTRLAEIVDESPIASFVLDQDHRVTHWNHACEKLTGAAAKTMVGTRDHSRIFYATDQPSIADMIISGHSDGELEGFHSMCRRSELIKGAFEAEKFFPHLGEKGCWLYVTAAPLHDATGQVVGAIETLRDITEQRQAEAALNERAEALQRALFDLQQTQDELIRSEKLASLGALVAGIAHELNTPIGNSLMVATHFVESSKKLEEATKTGLKRSMLEKYLADNRVTGDVLVRSLSKAAELVASFKQVAVDQTSSQRRKFELAEMVAEVVTILGPTIRKTPYVVEQNVPRNIHIESYPGPLGQVLTNLINNAIIHGFDGRACGSIRIEAEEFVDGEKVVIKVSDDGKGIPSEVLPRIFDPFFTTKLGQGGSGLGLNIVHNTVFGILGGWISVESTPGKGTCFTMTLPLTVTE